MSASRGIYLGMMASYLEMGVEIIKIDHENKILYITIPENSYVYNEAKLRESRLQSPDDLAKRIKETWIEMGIFPETCKVKYKTIPGYWSKEKGHKNREDNIHKFLNIPY